MNQPNGGWQQQPNPGQQPPVRQQYQGQPLYPGPQQPHPGQPYPGQPHPGQQQYPGQPPYPGPQQPYPGQPPYPGQTHPGGPRPPSKAMAVVAALLYLPPVLLALAGSISLASWRRTGIARELLGAIVMPPFPGVIIGFGLAVTISFVIPGLALVLVVLLMCRVPGVRWVLVVISLVAAVHFVLLLANVLSAFPPVFGLMPAIALVLWLVAGLVAALPPVGRAMRGARPKMPPSPMAGPQPPQVPGPPPQIPGPPNQVPGPPNQGQWG